MHFFFAFASRMWDMGIVLLVAEMSNNSLYLIALMGFISSAALFMFMSTIGAWLDRTDRLVAVQAIMVGKMVAITTAYSICGFLSSTGEDALDKALIYSIPLLAAIVSISFSAITQSIEKDWIVVLSDNDSVWLATTNSVMSQIDLACAAIAPAVTGYLFSFYRTGVVSLILILSNFVAATALYIYMAQLYHSWPTLAYRSSDRSSDKDVPLASKQHEAEQQRDKEYTYSSIEINSGVLNQKHTHSYESHSQWSLFYKRMGIVKFATSGCAGTMVSYSFLYFTVLSFGSLMTVYIRWAGVSDHWIGIFRSMAGR